MTADPPHTARPLETTEDNFLGGALRLRQPARGYRAGIDAVLLAATIWGGVSSPIRVLDAGAGVGTVGLCVARRVPNSYVTLLEREPAFADLARSNIDLNGLDERARVIEADILDKASELERYGLTPHSFDAVLANPPFHAAGEGTPARDPHRAGAHAMPSSMLERWGRFMARMARDGGTAAMIHKAEAIEQVLAALSPRFGALRVLPILPRPGMPAIRVIVAGVRGSRAPLTLLAPFVLHGAEGNDFTDQTMAILRDAGGLPGFTQPAPSDR